jgi:LmbE family N-acetylglucosaminyl deacetylase
MIELNLFQVKSDPLKVLCLGAHSDDIEIGCGGTILKFIRDYPTTEFHWVVFSSDETRKKEAEISSRAFLAGSASSTVTIKHFRDGYFPYIGAELKEDFEGIKREFTPDVILTHYRNDLHQDHRLVSDLTWNTFRDQMILEYEIPKYDGDLGAPNLFVCLDEFDCNRKVKSIMTFFASQAQNHWFTEDTLLSILRLRGIESNAPGRYAEAFYCRKLLF